MSYKIEHYFSSTGITKFYVIRYPQCYYLHKDITWHGSTVDVDNNYAGFFDTEKDAAKALIKFLASGMQLNNEEAAAVLNTIHAFHGRDINKVIEYAQNSS